MKFFFAAASIVSLSVLAVGCSSASPEETATDSTSSEDLTAAKLAGTYTITGATDTTPFNSIVLSANHTFTAMGGCRQDGPGVHCFAITSFKGTWKSTKSGPQLGDPAGAPELVFTDSLKNVNTFFYTLENDQLELSATFGGKKSLFDKDISKLPKLKSYDICADKDGNSVGQCPEDLPCEYDGPSGNTQRCLPPI